MIQYALQAHLEAKPGKEKEVEEFLKSALPIVQAETGTVAWFAIKIAPGRYGIFDVFHDEAGRDAHLSGKVAAALKQRGGELFSKPPAIDKIEVLAAKLKE